MFLVDSESLQFMIFKYFTYNVYIPLFLLKAFTLSTRITFYLSNDGVELHPNELLS